MIAHFADLFVDAVTARRTHLTVGLDPRLELLPAEMLDGVDDLAAAAAVAERFCAAIIDGVADLVPVVKPQSAFFEQFGSAGLAALERTIAHARARGLLVLEDAKRGDIGSTMAAYASTLLGRTQVGGRELPVQDVDAVTVNPYLGPEALAPAVEQADRFGKGLFVLVRTSNPASGELQELDASGSAVFEHVARMVDAIGAANVGERGFSNVGAVTGLTYPQAAARLRELMPRSLFLVPGLGRQGGRTADFPAFLTPTGHGATAAAASEVAGGWQALDGGGDAERRVRDGARQAAQRLIADLDGALRAADRAPW